MEELTEKEFFAIPENLKKLEGIEIGKYPISSEQILSKDDRGAVLNAAAECVEQKTPFSPDLEKLMKEFKVIQEEIVLKVVDRQIRRVLAGK